MTDSDTQNAPSEGDIQFAPSVVLPGEDLKPRIAPISNDVKVGRGIDSRIDGKSISATKSGILRFRPKNKFWVESNQKRCALCRLITAAPNIAFIIAMCADIYPLWTTL